MKSSKLTAGSLCPRCCSRLPKATADAQRRPSAGTALSRAALIAALGAPYGVSAQTNAPAANRESTAAAPGEIVVTAQRRAQSVQKVPISMTALGGAELTTRNITTTAALSQATPNLYQTSASLSGGPIAIRGVSTFNVNAGIDQAVAVYIDDVYQGTAVGSAINLFDVERVEVLRGPQSTFFGRNSLAGAVSITTRRPDYKLRGLAEASYGTYNAYSVRGLVNLPLKDDFAALSLGVSRSERDGYDHNIAQNVDVNNDDRTNARAQLRLQPSSNIDILATYEYLSARDRRAFDPVQLNGSPSGAPGLNVTAIEPITGLNVFTVPFSANGYDHKLSSDTRAFQRLESHTGSLRVSVDLDWSNLLLISSYRQYRLDDLFDADITEAPLATGYNPESYRAFTQEVRLSSRKAGPLTWIAGATYHSQNTHNFNAAGTFPLDAALFGAPDLPTGLSAVNGRVATESYSGFGRIDWQATERLALGVGGRFTHEIKRLRTSQTAAPFNAIVFGFPDAPVASARYTYDDFSPEIKLSFAPASQRLLYVSVSKGFKGGGFNDQQITTDQLQSGAYLRPFKREQLWNYEVGFKGTFLDRRLTIDAAAFYSDWYDRQFQSLVASGGIQSLVISTSGDARVVGAELDVRARPFDGLDLYLNGGYNNVKQTKSLIPEIRRGDIIRDNPQYSMSVGGTYTVALRRESRIETTVGFNLIGPNVITLGGSVAPGDDPALRIANDVHGLLNARISYILPGNKVTVSVYGDNLTDNRWISDEFNSTYSIPFYGVAGVILGPPRTVGISGSLRF